MGGGSIPLPVAHAAAPDGAATRAPVGGTGAAGRRGGGGGQGRERGPPSAGAGAWSAFLPGGPRPGACLPASAGRGGEWVEAEGESV